MTGAAWSRLNGGVGLLLLVAAGGAFGAGVRSLVQASATGLGGSPSLWLFLVNLSGSLVLGAAFARLDPRAPKVLDLVDAEVPATELPGARAHHPILAAFLAVGFCGALTTWSSLAHEAVRLWIGGEVAASVGLLVGSIVLGPLAVALGASLGRRRA